MVVMAGKNDGSNRCPNVRLLDVLRTYTVAAQVVEDRGDAAPLAFQSVAIKLCSNMREVGIFSERRDDHHAANIAIGVFVSDGRQWYI